MLGASTAVTGVVSGACTGAAGTGSVSSITVAGAWGSVGCTCLCIGVVVCACTGDC